MDWKIDHPLSAIPAERYGTEPGSVGPIEGIRSHLRKRTYRVTVPLIAHIMGFHLQGAELISFAAGCGFVWLLFVNARKVFENELAAALLLGIALAGSFISQWSLNNLYFFDGAGYFFLAAACAANRPWLIALCITLGGFSDERVVMAIPLVYLLQEERPLSCLTFRGLLRLNPGRIGTLAGTALFLLLRLLFILNTGSLYDRSKVGFSTFLPNLEVAPINALLVFKGSALIILAGLVALAFRSSKQALLLVLVAAIPSVATTLLVDDMARSLAYSFPLVFLCASALWQISSRRLTQRLLLCAALLSTLLPTFYLWQSKLLPYLPLPYVAVKPVVRLVRFARTPAAPGVPAAHR